MTKRKPELQTRPAGTKPHAGPQQKVTKVERERRVGIIYDLLVNGASRRAILQYCAERHNSGDPDMIAAARAAGKQHIATPADDWQVKVRAIDGYIAAAGILFEKVADIKRGQRLGRALTRLDHLYRSSLGAGDNRTALQVVRTEADLLGLEPPKKVITGQVDPMSPEGLLLLFNRAGEERKAAEPPRAEKANDDPDDDPDEDVTNL